MSKDIIREHARLIILRALIEQPNMALNDALLQATLETFGIAHSREWVREELRRMADLGAVTLTEAGTVTVATATSKGADHVERRVVIEGIKRPSPGE
ncbi:MAG: hypothetical protein WEC82_07120 [Xanthobacteraceae bacterium]